MTRTDEDTLTKKPLFTLPNVMDVLKKSKKESTTGTENDRNKKLLKKEMECCDAATD